MGHFDGAVGGQCAWSIDGDSSADAHHGVRYCHCQDPDGGRELHASEIRNSLHLVSLDSSIVGHAGTVYGAFTGHHETRRCELGELYGHTVMRETTYVTFRNRLFSQVKLIV